MTTIVIVEDEGLIAFNLALVVQERTQAEVVTAASVAEAQRRIDDETAFAFLDVNVRDGDTCGLARELKTRGIPFAFTSGSKREALPDDLQTAPFITKPFADVDIANALAAGLSSRVARHQARGC